MTSDELADLIRKSVVILRSNPSDYLDQGALVRLVTVMTSIIQSGTAPDFDIPEDYDLQLWRALALCSVDEIAYCFKSMSLSNDELCLGQLVSLAALRLVLQSASAAELARQTATKLWKSTVDPAHDVAVALYTASEMSDALMLLRKECVVCTYCNQISLYLGALAYRAAELVTMRWPDAVHDKPALRTEVQPGVFECSSLFVSQMWTTLSAMYRRVLHATATGLQPQAVEKPSAEEQRDLDKLKAFLLERVRKLKLHKVAYVVRSAYAETQLRPGDMEMTRHTSQEIMPRPLGIIKSTSEPARMEKIASAGETPLGTTLLAELPALVPGSPESALLSLCLCELMEVLSNSCGQASFGSAFAVVEPDIFRTGSSLQATIAATDDRPVVLQVFNHWQLGYRSKLYMYNSFLRALLAWLRMVRAEYESGKPERLQDHIGLAFISQQSIYNELIKALAPAPADDRRP